MRLDTNFRLEKACASGPGRYSMESAFLDTEDEGAPKLVATDGRILAVVPLDPEEVEEGETSGPVTVEALREARKPARRLPNGLGARIVANGGLEIGRPQEPVTLPRPEGGEFPRWRAVVKDNSGGFRVAFNPRILLALAEAIGSPNGLALTFAPGKKATTHPIRVDPCGEHARTGADPAFGIIMPITVDG